MVEGESSKKSAMSSEPLVRITKKKIPSTIVTSRTVPKIKSEPLRTTKTGRKLVVFPEGEFDQISPEATLGEGDTSEMRTMPETYEGAPLRRVTALQLSESIKIGEIQDFHLKRLQHFATPKRYDEVLYMPVSFETLETQQKFNNFAEAVASDCDIGEVFVFDYGTIVLWGFRESVENRIIEELREFFVSPLPEEDLEIEYFCFCHSEDQQSKIFNDIINLRSGHHMNKLTISHALAQSVKLGYFEGVITENVLKTERLPYELATTGTIQLSRNDINKQIGELFIMKMNVNLISNVLDAPELFWSFPSLSPLYESVRGYLELSQRVEVLNQRVEALNGILDMLKDHINTHHAEYIEWIIVFLIGFEIIISLAHFAILIYNGVDVSL